MKLALCFSGQPRFVNECSDLIINNAIQDYDVDVFAHLWFDDDLKIINAKNRRIGTCFTLILPSIFLFSWLLTIALVQGKAMNTYYDASPYEQVPCLSQFEWMEIVSEGNIDVDPLNYTICANWKDSVLGRRAL